MINDFEFTQPQNLPEALDALTQSGKNVPLAGGTNVLVYMKRTPLEADRVVDISQLESLEGISTENGEVKLGAGVTFAQLMDWRPGGAVEALMRPMCAGFAGPLIWLT